MDVRDIKKHKINVPKNSTDNICNNEYLTHNCTNECIKKYPNFNKYIYFFNHDYHYYYIYMSLLSPCHD